MPGSVSLLPKSAIGERAEMKPWQESSFEDLKRVRGVCLDIDDTLSTAGKLTAEAYSSLWNLKNEGYFVVPITGRPAGWCDQIARFWPVDAVVGENGAFTFLMKEGVRRALYTPSEISDGRAKLKKLGEEILKRFPHAKWASDQSYREYDLAIDVCEDVQAWPSSDVDELLAICIGHGAHAKLSSVHVNTWFGNYDKKSGFRHFLSETPSMPAESSWLFIGDSPNDEPMFESFPFSVGVANLAQYMSKLKNPPRWITAGKSGQGFSQMAERLISSKNG
jgi:HAD superfamily hydrolase (TIGR01484 family)